MRTKRPWQQMLPRPRKNLPASAGRELDQKLIRSPNSIWRGAPRKSTPVPAPATLEAQAVDPLAVVPSIEHGMPFKTPERLEATPTAIGERSKLAKLNTL